jgi:hypothetical protein
MKVMAVCPVAKIALKGMRAVFQVVSMTPPSTR